ncbi:WD repeat and HMG-box DNA-binding protein 1 [Hypsibius exemplaris]|uniref:WD repeat and HMG-box DNA-binding protein 1 n=1 Tax=Hypsibius exemplaris TaxID=2072580 RepID=A0A1W0WCA3_HYPEX|nr:WD repeat and HMG-box DNA-binding protein 1 [Hypsibius exemplaris]
MVLPERQLYNFDNADLDHTDVCFDESGKFILTINSTSFDVQQLEGLEDADKHDYSLDAPGYAICSRGDLYYVASGSRIQARQLGEADSETVIASFGEAATCLAISADGSFLAAGAADFNIRIVTLEGATMVDTHVCPGHTAPVLSLALDPKGEFLASSACDGSLKIWDVKKHACLKTIEAVIPKSNDFLTSKTLGRMSFAPGSGALLAMPSGKEVKLHSRPSWESVGTLSDVAATKADVSIAAFSPDGSHIAAAHNDGVIVIYHTASRKSVNVFKTKRQRAICAIQWSPVARSASLVYADTFGSVGVVEKAYSLTPKPSAEVNGATSKNSGDAAHTNGATACPPKGAPSTTTLLMNSDDEDSNHPTERSAGQSGATSISPEDFVIKDDDTESTIEAIKSRIKACPQPIHHAPVEKRTEPQEAFQPGSTPSAWKDSFMVWNEYGYMKLYRDEEGDEDSIKRGIDVVFHNNTHHHTITVMNADNFTLGTMNLKGYLLATEKHSAGEAKSSKIHFSALGGSDKDKWTLDLDKGEWVEGLAIGEEWCYVATSRRMLRVITFSGYQQYVIDFTGPLVTVAARQKLLIIAYHQNDPTLKGDQCIGFSMYIMSHRRVELVVADERLPLSPKATLHWLGFGMRGTPTSADSTGLVRMFHYRMPLQKIWSPRLDMQTKVRRKAERFFMYAVDEDERKVRALICLASRYPLTVPTPTPVQLPFETLQAGGDSDVAKLEATCTLHRLFPQKTEKFLRQCRGDVLRMFALHCKTDNDNRAKDIAQLMPTSKDIEGCWKWAHSVGKTGLADQLEALIMALKKEEDDEDDLVARAPSPELFESSQPVYDDPLGKSLQKVRRPNHQRPTGTPLATVSVKKNLSNTLTGTKAGRESDSDDDADRWTRDKPADRTTKPIATSAVKPNGTVKRVREEVNLEDSEDNDDDESSRSSHGTVTNPTATSSSTASETMMIGDDTVITPSTTARRNPLKKATEVAPLLRGISTMEEKTKSKATAAVSSGFSTPGTTNKRKAPVVKAKGKEPAAAGGSEPAPKRGRPKGGGSIGKGDADAELTATAVPHQSLFEKFGWKRQERKVEGGRVGEGEEMMVVDEETHGSAEADDDM